ncbi:MAG: antiterminator LoaP [Spirochaetia bacterium]
MEYYALQIWTREEERYLKLAQNYLDINLPGWRNWARFLWPRRKLTVRRRGKKREELAPIFPSYLFIESEEISPEMYWILKRTGGFIRFLKSNQNIEPLRGHERKLLLHFLQFGEVVEKSHVTFDENSRIQVIDGPMKGMEGRVVKVDKRKKRAKIRLTFYEEAFLIDFGFEFLEKVQDKNKAS